ncbi:MAG: hypothetical protein KY475_25850 [Planctomycetes bacterium]|nr:hypothetical protein [Planctomycetota bacterium]
MIHKTQIVDVDTTIDDIHRTRERLAEKFGGDIKAILEDARQRQAASGRPIWQGTPTTETVEDEKAGQDS